MFTKEGTVKVTIKEAILADNKFHPEDTSKFDVCLFVEDAEGESDWWHGEMSAYIPQQGAWNKDGKSQARLTIESLVRVGFEGGEDLSRIAELVGKETVATIKAVKSTDGTKTYYNVKSVGGGGNAPKVIDVNDAQRRMAAIMGKPFPGASTSTTKPLPVINQSAPVKAPGKIANPF